MSKKILKKIKVKLADKNQRIKIKLTRLNERLNQIKNKNLVVLSVSKKIGLWFSGYTL